MRAVELLPYIECSPRTGGTERIYADSWEHEDLTLPTSVTEVPVESGARVTDHIRNEPITLKCRMVFSGSPIRGDLDRAHKGVVTTYPLNVPPYPNLTPLLTPGGLTKAVEGGIAAVANAIGLGGADGAKSATALMFPDGPPGRLREVITRLTQWREDKELFTVGASTVRLENMALVSLGCSRQADDGDSGALDLEFTQIAFVSTQVTLAVPLPLEPRGQGKKGGKSGAEPVPDGPKQKTVGAALVDSFFGPPGPTPPAGF